jgi:hypothetical protein
MYDIGLFEIVLIAGVLACFCCTFSSVLSYLKRFLFRKDEDE